MLLRTSPASTTHIACRLYPPPRQLSNSLQVMGLAFMAPIFGCFPPSAESQNAASSTSRAALITDLRGAAYVQHCRDQGVPVPDWVADPNDPAWDDHGEITEPFISALSDPPMAGIPLESELWSWISSSPDGICLALPRWFKQGANVDRASLFGLICMGRESSKACFFDNPNGVYFQRNQRHPITAFLGGAALESNEQGVCTDCHAGENPFVVHPDKDAFKHLANQAPRNQRMRPRSGWHEPIAPGGLPGRPWPQNPGPERRLDTVASAGTCTGCHQLPALSNQLQSYCNSVLDPAVTRVDETMPQPSGRGGLTFSEYRALFEPHIDAAWNLCRQPPLVANPGVPVTGVTHVDDLSVVSPPTVAAPLYECARGVAVRGAIADAKVELWIDGVLVDTAKANEEGLAGFELATDLVEPQLVWARTSLGSGVHSGPSNQVQVEKYAYAALPKPAIDPSTVYACANSIAVRNLVPGVKLTAWQNGIDPQVTYTRSQGQSMGPGPKPWDKGDVFTVQASLCGLQSVLSDAVTAEDPPETLASPVLDPPKTYAGQEILVLRDMTYGSFGRVSRTAPPNSLYLGDTCGSATGVSCVFRFPTSALGRPLLENESVSVEPSLYCPSGSPTGPPTKSPPALPCSELPHPVVAHPIIGQDHIVVLEALPGARIRVYDASGAEIADGTGTVVRLAPPRTFVAGDVITVVQQVGTCFGTTGFRIGAITGTTGGGEGQ